jgi:hypothetical protein
MRGLLAAVILLATASGADAADKADRCAPQVLADVELGMTPAGDVYLPASLNGHDVYFRLAIGSGVPWILESAVEPLGLKILTRTGGAEVKAGGQRITQYANLVKMKVGAYGLLTRAALVVPGTEPPDTFEGRPVVGTMGSTLIRNVDAELHLSERRFRLLKPFACFDRTPVYWGAEAAALPMRFDEAHTLVFALEIDGNKVESSLLNGSSISTIDVAVTREFFGFDQDSAGVQVYPSPEGGSQALFHAMSLTGRALTITDVPVLMSTRTNGVKCKTGYLSQLRAIGYENCVNSVPFNLGTDLLTRMRVYISPKRRTVYISTVGAPAPGAPGSITVDPRR